MKSFAKLSLVVVVLLAATASSRAITFDVALDTDQEIPAPVLNGSTPSGMATLDVNTITGELTVSGSYAGMTSDVAASHLHGLAAPGVTAGVLIGFDASGGTTGTVTGGGMLTPENLAGLLAGQTYVNVHTANNGPGEIRGQVVDSDVKVFNLILNTDQEIPAPAVGDATPMGAATVVVDTSTGAIEISGSYQGMSSEVMAAHLHGLAGPAATAGVIFGFDVSGGTEGMFSGSETLSADNLAGLLNGQTYLNVHTANNGSGEIRSQVVPEPTSFGLLLVGCLAIIRIRRRR